MKTLKCLAAHVLAAVSLLAAGTSFAYDRHDDRYDDRYDDRHPGAHARPAPLASLHLQREINQRQEFQRERILAARERGQLTQREFRRLMADQREIRELERDFLADGRLSRHEYERLDRALDAARRDIRDEARDYAQAPRGPRHQYN